MSSSANIWVPIFVAIVTGLLTVVTIFLTGRAESARRGTGRVRQTLERILLILGTYLQ